MATSDSPLSVPDVTLAVARSQASDYVGLTNPARQFEVKIDAAGGTLGQEVENSSGIINGKQVFTGLAGGTTYSDEAQIDGQNVLKMTVTSGANGFGELGGAAEFGNYPSVGHDLFKGDEFWLKAKVRFPSSGWQWNGGRNKFFRANVRLADGTTNVGRIDLYLNGNNSQDETFQFSWIFEGEGNWTYGVGSPISFDTDHDIEMHIVLDNVPGSEGGKALQRVWVDGVLHIESTKRTLNNATDLVDYVGQYLYYGNDLAPDDLFMYTKEFIVRSSVPSQRDAAGNPLIGV